MTSKQNFPTSQGLEGAGMNSRALLYHWWMLLL